MIEISTRARPPVTELMKRSTERLRKKSADITAEKRQAEQRGDQTALRRLKVAERALQLRAQTLGEALQVARKQS
jgi:hypothetical protein